MNVPHHILMAARQTDRAIYVYDLNILRERLDQLIALPIARKRIHFASMANDNLQILTAVAEAGHGVFVNSVGHLALAHKAGFPSNRIIFASSNMIESEMHACLAAGIHVVLDSASQVEAFDAIAPTGTKVGVRVNVGSAIEAATLSEESSYRFGHTPAELLTSLRRARNLSIVGVHSYFGTDIMEPEVLLQGLKRLAELGPMLPDLEYIDGGGGFGIPDDFAEPSFDLGAYGRGANAIMASLQKRLGRPVTLVIEPGRWLTAPIGWFFTRVVDIKERTDRLFIGTTASVAQFPRLLFYPETARHPCEIIDADERPLASQPVWIAGNSTYSRDFLARGIRIAAPRVGDIIVFHHAGAYCRSMFTRFLGKEYPDEVVLDMIFDQNVGVAALVETAE